MRRKKSPIKEKLAGKCLLRELQIIYIDYKERPAKYGRKGGWCNEDSLRHKKSYLSRTSGKIRFSHQLRIARKGYSKIKCNRFYITEMVNAQVMSYLSLVGGVASQSGPIARYST